LVITNHGRTGSPLIRYATGDLVATDPNPCPCGRDLIRLPGGILGRADDMVTIRGNNVFPSTIESVLREFDQIVEFQVEVHTGHSLPHLVIRVEPQSSLSDAHTADMISSIEQTIKDRLNFRAEITAVEENSLPRFELKGRRFVKVSHL
ncbi:MAG: phenylacetate--CoA ligase family protein, partial [Planctomycetaceae bacterium]